MDDFLPKQLQPSKGYFWRWEDNHSVICLFDGSTVFYTEEMLTAYASMKDPQLLPLGTLVLILEALEREDRLARIKAHLRNSPVINELKDIGNLIEKGFEFCDRLNACANRLSLYGKRWDLILHLSLQAHRRHSIKQTRRELRLLKDILDGKLRMKSEESIFLDYNTLN